MKNWLYHPRMAIDYNPIENLSANIKHMSQNFDGFK